MTALFSGDLWKRAKFSVDDGDGWAVIEVNLSTQRIEDGELVADARLPFTRRIFGATPMAGLVFEEGDLVTDTDDDFEWVDEPIEELAPRIL